MSNNISNDFFQNKSQALRTNQSPIEHMLWCKLRRNQLGVKFRRQYPIHNRYIVDFMCLEKNLIIELDGNEHALSEKDNERDSYLKANNFTVLRFWNNQIYNKLDECINFIYDAIK